MCGPSTRRAASGKLAGLVQYDVGLISLHARVKIGGLGLIFCPLIRHEITKYHKGSLHLFTPGSLRFQ